MKNIKLQVEHKIQKSIAEFLDLALEENVLWTSVEVSNQRGGKAGLLMQMELKRRGVKTGWPDIQIFWLDVAGNKQVACLEVKAPGCEPSAAQRSIHKRLGRLGVPVAVVSVLEEVAEFLVECGIPHKKIMLF